MMKVLQFKNYRTFKTYLRKLQKLPTAYNRPVKDSHVKKMKESVENHGILRPILVIKTKVFNTNGKYELFIADGQHLIAAIFLLKNDPGGIHMVTQRVMDDIDEIISMVSQINSTAAKWKLIDYLGMWATYGRYNYKFLKKTLNDTGLRLYWLLEAYSASQTRQLDNFKHGTFKLNKARGADIVDLYKEAVSCGLRQNSGSFGAVIRFYNNPAYDRKTLLEGIAKNGVFRFKLGRDSYLSLFKLHCANGTTGNGKKPRRKRKTMTKLEAELMA